MRRLGILGTGREGLAAWRHLRQREPEALIWLWPNKDEPPPIGLELDPRSLWVSGEVSDAQLRDCDLVVKSPGISPYVDPVAAALKAGVAFTSATNLWFAAHPGRRVIAITGTKGKSTTTRLVEFLLNAAGVRARAGGNIGMPLLELPEVAITVAELSSYQLADFDAEVELGVVLNLSPEHLTWHVSLERYYADKLRLLDHARVALVNGREPLLVAASRSHRAAHLYGVAGQWQRIAGELDRDGERIAVGWSLIGAHNLDNLAAAVQAVELLGVDPRVGLARIVEFQPLAHRLTTVAERSGVRFVDDSIATTPVATLAAIACFDRARVIVLVGGYDRGLDWTGFAQALEASPVKSVLCFGALGPRIASGLADGAVSQPTECHATLAQAVGRALVLARPGDMVLLSPGAPSFDAYDDYAARGRAFAAMVGAGPAEL